MTPRSAFLMLMNVKMRQFKKDDYRIYRDQIESDNPYYGEENNYILIVDGDYLIIKDLEIDETHMFRLKEI